MARNLDLTWMDEPLKAPLDVPFDEAPPIKVPPSLPQIKSCSLCGDPWPWYGLRGVWFCDMCAPRNLKRPREDNVLLNP